MNIVSNINATIIRRIGADQGRNSEVFLAHDPQLNGDIVLKNIPIDSFDSPDEYFREAQILYANKSPRIVPVQYACKDSDCVRIAMPYFRNGSLEDLMSNRFLTTREIIRWIDQVLTGLHYVHSNDFVHFDIKPSNVLFHDDFSATLSDFGQSRKTNILGVVEETPPIYGSSLPPEVFDLSLLDSSADMYQIGITLYRMCNGNNHFRSQIPANINDLPQLITTGKFPNRNKFLPQIPRRLRRITKRLLSVDPSNRYGTTIDLQNDLGQINTLLDWEYHPSDRAIIWKMQNGNQEYRIMISSTSRTHWVVNGYSTNLTTGTQRRKTTWCSNAYSTCLQATNFVDSIFREME